MTWRLRVVVKMPGAGAVDGAGEVEDGHDGLMGSPVKMGDLVPVGGHGW